MNSRVLGLKLPKISLFASIGLAFALSVLPILFFIISYSYRANARNLFELTRSYSEKADKDTMAAVEDLIGPVAGTLRSAAELASLEPAFFRGDASRDYMHAAMVSEPQIDAMYTSFEDGYHRAVTRVDAVRRRHDPRIPAAALWHSSWVAPDRGEKTRWRHRTFFDEWPRVVVSYDAVFEQDPRKLTQYVGAKSTGKLFVAEPNINPDTGGPVISLGYPILRGGRFTGFAAANITLGNIARYLDAHRVSPRSVTFIADAEGRVVAHPDLSKCVRAAAGGALEFIKAAEFPDPAVRLALSERSRRGSDRFVFRAGEPAAEYSASFAPFPESFGKKWEVVTLTPTDDFLGVLKASNRRLLVIMSILVLIELALIWLVARFLAAPIDTLSAEVAHLRSLSFDGAPRRESPIREVARLEKALELLRHSLSSFATFVPIGVVRRLVSSGKPLARSVESKELTLLFSDLENFTTTSESLSPDKLSEQLTAYFEHATSAVAQEGGTLDKFIGDAVMAFWGAPAATDDQIMRACAAALRIASRVQIQNEEWIAAGRPPMYARIGLHHGRALVGNIGSSTRLSYTAIGDAVNVASRLEGVNKEYGTTICISETVYKAVKDRVIAKLIETVKLKGRHKELKIYELMGIRETRESELMAKPRVQKELR